MTDFMIYDVILTHNDVKIKNTGQNKSEHAVVHFLEGWREWPVRVLAQVGPDELEQVGEQLGIDWPALFIWTFWRFFT